MAQPHAQHELVFLEGLLGKILIAWFHVSGHSTLMPALDTTLFQTRASSSTLRVKSALLVATAGGLMERRRWAMPVEAVRLVVVLAAVGLAAQGA